VQFRVKRAEYGHGDIPVKRLQNRGIIQKQDVGIAFQFVPGMAEETADAVIRVDESHGHLVPAEFQTVGFQQEIEELGGGIAVEQRDFEVTESLQCFFIAAGVFEQGFKPFIEFRDIIKHGHAGYSLK